MSTFSIKSVALRRGIWDLWSVKVWFCNEVAVRTTIIDSKTLSEKRQCTLQLHIPFGHLRRQGLVKTDR